MNLFRNIEDAKTLQISAGNRFCFIESEYNVVAIPVNGKLEQKMYLLEFSGIPLVTNSKEVLEAYIKCYNQNSSNLIEDAERYLVDIL